MRRRDGRTRISRRPDNGREFSRERRVSRLSYEKLLMFLNAPRDAVAADGAGEGGGLPPLSLFAGASLPVRHNGTFARGYSRVLLANPRKRERERDRKGGKARRKERKRKTTQRPSGATRPTGRAKRIHLNSYLAPYFHTIAKPDERALLS